MQTETKYTISKNIRNDTEINTSIALPDNKLIVFTTMKRYNGLATTVRLCTLVSYGTGRMVQYSSDDYSTTLVLEQGKALKSKLIAMHLKGLDQLEKVKKEIEEFYSKN
jgi:hypothetical protein